MHGDSAHSSDIAHIDSHGFVADGVRWMNSAYKVGVFGKKIGAKQRGVPVGDIEDCSIVSNSQDDTGILKLHADALDETVLAQVAEKHLPRLPRCRR